VAATQDGEQNQRADDGNNDRAKTAEPVREESEHRLISSGDAPSFALLSGGWRRGGTSAQLAEARVSILYADALDFSTNRDDRGGQSRESLSRIASPSAAVATLVLRPLFAERKSGARICGPHEQTQANPAQPRERLEDAGERYVGRPTVWGNPYVVGSELMNGETLTAEKAVELYKQHLADNFSESDIRHCLHDKDLACWCALHEPCHADVLLRIANSRPK
jgi:hypothetical protein